MAPWMARIVHTVPRFPAIAMPPNAVSTAPRSNACLMSSWPTTAVRGIERVSLEGPWDGLGKSVAEAFYQALRLKHSNSFDSE